jgi:hypothetical protein
MLSFHVHNSHLQAQRSHCGFKAALLLFHLSRFKFRLLTVRSGNPHSVRHSGAIVDYWMVYVPIGTYCVLVAIEWVR